ncbi:hypothetical protein ABZY09_01715 [Streptomyces sp. NPDC002928]|uniref:hypothetical protein n=1 Tax=Streptomyces sp. NPDC002928 TaxID=3154440 RepID=UPI0033A4D67B
MHLGSERSHDSQLQPQRIRRAAVRQYDRRTTVRTRQHCLDEFCLVAAELAVKYDLVRTAENEVGNPVPYSAIGSGGASHIG